MKCYSSINIFTPKVHKFKLNNKTIPRFEILEWYLSGRLVDGMVKEFPYYQYIYIQSHFNDCSRWIQQVQANSYMKQSHYDTLEHVLKPQSILGTTTRNKRSFCRCIICLWFSFIQLHSPVIIMLILVWCVGCDILFTVNCFVEICYCISL